MISIIVQTILGRKDAFLVYVYLGNILKPLSLMHFHLLLPLGERAKCLGDTPSHLPQITLLSTNYPEPESSG